MLSSEVNVVNGRAVAKDAGYKDSSILKEENGYQQVEKDAKTVAEKMDFGVGNRVKVTEGPFKGRAGTITSYGGTYSCVVKLDKGERQDFSIFYLKKMSDSIDAIPSCPECNKSLSSMDPGEINKHIDDEIRLLYNKAAKLEKVTTRIIALERMRKSAIYGDATGWKRDMTGSEYNQMVKILEDRQRVAQESGDPEQARFYRSEMESLYNEYHSQRRAVGKSRDCKASDIGFGDGGYKCHNCGAHDKIAGKIKHTKHADASPADVEALKEYHRKKEEEKKKASGAKDDNVLGQEEVGFNEEDIFTEDPLTAKGEKIMSNMKEQYGEKKGEELFDAKEDNNG